MVAHYHATVKGIVNRVREGREKGEVLWTAEVLARAVLPATKDVRQIREHLGAAKAALHDPDIIGLTVLAKKHRHELAAGSDAENQLQAQMWIAGNLGANHNDRLMWALLDTNGLPQDGFLATANRERKLRVSRGVLEAAVNKYGHDLIVKGLAPEKAKAEIERFRLRFGDPETVALLLAALGHRPELEEGIDDVREVNVQEEEAVS